MRALIGTLATSAAACLFALVSAAPAQAYSSQPLTICNKTSAVLGIAFGYHSPGVNDPADHSLLTGPFVTIGWKTLDPGACGTFDNPFNARYMYWFGTSKDFHDNIMAVGNETYYASPQERFCVTNYFSSTRGTTVRNFTFESENVKDPSGMSASDACQGAGDNLWVRFRSVDTWVNPTVDFTGP
jgi:uncharacterized membrane protein